MNRNARFVLTSVIGATMIFVGIACKGGTESQPVNPTPPAEPAPRPTAPAQQQPEDGAAAEAPEAPAGEAAGAAGGAGQEEGGTAVAVSPAAQKEADDLFNSLCSTCHGMTGAGDGPVAAGFPTKPASFTSEEVQNSVTDEQIAKVIVEGGPAIGKSPLMPGNPGLKDKPEVVQALVNKVRSFAK